ncbi:MAG: hypothetical protein QXU18_03460 [Thermoplasmatales archaeon]
MSRNSVLKYLKNELVKVHLNKNGSKHDLYEDILKTLFEKYNLSAVKKLEDITKKHKMVDT